MVLKFSPLAYTQHNSAVNTYAKITTAAQVKIAGGVGPALPLVLTTASHLLAAVATQIHFKLNV